MKNFGIKIARTLKELRPGEEGVVEKVTAEGALRRRIFDMGLTPGAEVKVKKAAPFGDPLECTVRGYELLIRKSEAEQILIKVTGNREQGTGNREGLGSEIRTDRKSE